MKKEFDNKEKKKSFLFRKIKLWQIILIGFAISALLMLSEVLIFKFL